MLRLLRFAALIVLLALLAGEVFAAPLLSARQSSRFMREVARRENRFYQPGVGFDARTGLTFDGVNIDFRTGRVVSHRNWSAPSKESLHIELLVKAVAGDRTAQTMIAPDPDRPQLAGARALDTLTRKIESYERFNRQYPGFGGFLPWFKVQDGRLLPIPAAGKDPGWERRVPGLDNGQLAWSLYYAAGQLEALGHHDLARRYRAQLERMERNVVRIFFDPKAGKMRAEASLLRGGSVPPSRNKYAVNSGNAYYLEDSYEGLLLCHFADLFGNWGKSEKARESIWREPRRKPATYRTADGQPITVAKAWIGSSHEEWGDTVLPFADLPIHRELQLNAQRARTAFSADEGIPGLFASSHRPMRRTGMPNYEPMLGIAGGDATIDSNPRRKDIVVPYAAFPLALVKGGKRYYATWLKTMLEAPRMLGPLGIGESCSVKGNAIAPCLTWDGKALPMLAWMGGVRNEVRSQLERDGKYQPFLDRVREDYRLFQGKKIEGKRQPLRTPTAAVAHGMRDFWRQ